jgi:hypothetical protein
MTTRATAAPRGGWLHTHRARISRDELSLNERKVLAALAVRMNEDVTIRELARACFQSIRPIVRADSWVKNALRRLVVGSYVRKVARGTYRALPKAWKQPRTNGRTSMAGLGVED